MGCCQSTERAEENDAPRRPQSPSRNPDDEPSREAGNRHGRGNAGNASSAVNPDNRIRAPSPLPSSPSHVSHQQPPWTRKQLEREREAFFDTRVSGNQEIWKGLRMVCDLLSKGQITEAQGILDAMNMTCPTGKVSRSRGRNKRGGLWDERGHLYDIPNWVVTDPEDIIEDEEKETTDGAADDEDKDADIASSPHRVEKGKGRAEDPGETVQVRTRLSDRGTDILVSVGMKEKIAVIIRSMQAEIGPKRIRLVYLGKTLEEQSALESCGWKEGHVINALVYED